MDNFQYRKAGRPVVDRQLVSSRQVVDRILAPKVCLRIRIRYLPHATWMPIQNLYPGPSDFRYTLWYQKNFYCFIFRQFVKKCRNDKKVQKRNCACLVFITVVKLTPYMILQGVMMKIDSYQNIMPGTAYRLVITCCIIFQITMCFFRSMEYFPPCVHSGPPVSGSSKTAPAISNQN